MNIAIIEDDYKELENLQICIKNFFTKKNISYTANVFIEPEELIQCADEIDMAFLDIQINSDINGIDVGIDLRKKNKDMKIIFISNYSEYLIDGYRADANRFFTKPISQDHFDIEINNVLEDYLMRFSGFTDYKICNHKIYFKDILYIEFINRKTVLHFINGTQIETVYPLRYWLDKIRDLPFAQPYKSILVNLNQISCFKTNSILLVNNEQIPMSKHYKKVFEDAYSHNFHRRM